MFGLPEAWLRMIDELAARVEECKAGAATAAAEHLLLAFQSVINISIYPNIALLGRQCCLGLFNCYSWHSCTPVCNARCEFLMGSTRLFFFPPFSEHFLWINLALFTEIVPLRFIQWVRLVYDGCLTPLLPPCPVFTRDKDKDNKWRTTCDEASPSQLANAEGNRVGNETRVAKQLPVFYTALKCTAHKSPNVTWLCAIKFKYYICLYFVHEPFQPFTAHSVK